MCDCIQKIIEKTEGREYAVDATVGSFNHQSSEVRYTPIRLDGEPSKHRRYTSANWKFCPWCGEQI